MILPNSSAFCYKQKQPEWFRITGGKARLHASFCAKRIWTQAVGLSGRIGVSFRGKACWFGGNALVAPPPVTVSCLLGGGLFTFTPGAKLVTTGELQAGWANLMEGGKKES